MQEYLHKPEATEWKEGAWSHSRFRDPSEKFLALEDKKTNKSFAISDSPTGFDDEGIRTMQIQVVDLGEQQDDHIKRGRCIRIRYTKKGIVSTWGANSDSEGFSPNPNPKEDPYSKENWYSGDRTYHGESFGNSTKALTDQDLEKMMADMKGELESATVDRKFSEQIPAYAVWANELEFAMLEFFPLHMVKDPEFQVIYLALKKEITNNGRKNMSNEEIDRKIKEIFYAAKTDRLRRKSLQEKRPMEDEKKERETPLPSVA